MIRLGILVNLTLAVFNLIPLPPLDGSKVVQGLVRPALADRIDGWAPQAQVVFIALLLTGVLGYFIAPARWGFHVLRAVAGDV